MKNLMIKSLLALIILTSPLLGSCATMNPQSPNSKPISHESFNQLLVKHVDNNGMVNYKGIKSDMTQLDQYIELLEKNAPNDTHWSKDQQLTFWINAYNANTIKLVLKYYPIESIKDLGSKIKIPFVSTAWDIKFINIGDEELSLNNIEHNIIRKNFEEPRIHFALVCAAKSCPKLLNEAYVTSKLDEQLTSQAKVFLADKSKNDITASKIKISNLFSWYGGDFTKNSNLITYLNRYAPVQIDKKAKKSFMVYDWSLNEQ